MTFVSYISFVPSWCCRALAVLFGDELRCKSCGNLLFDDHYWCQRYRIEGDDLHTSPVANPRRPE
jgi:hypothetical protein